MAKEKKNAPNLMERALFLFSPDAGNSLYKKRINREKSAHTEKPKGGNVLARGGYGNHGASTTLTSLAGWIVNGGSAQEDIDSHSRTLRQRTRDLYAGGGLGRSGPVALVTNVVGWGLKPKPKIDSELLGMSDEAADEWERNTLREFRLWAENPMCDAERQMNFFALQELAFRSQLMSGDVFVLFVYKDNKRTPYKTAIRLLEADRISTPQDVGGGSVQETKGGGLIVEGVEIDKEGAVIAYYVTSKHPLKESLGGSEIKHTKIDAFGKETGYPNILHITTRERPEQRRGIPFVSAQIEKIKQLDRYLNSELAANVVASMLTAFLESETDDGEMGLEDAVNENDKITNDELNLELAPGAIYDLPPGKKVTSINPIRNNSAFEAFVSAAEKTIGSSMEIPKEVLTKKYESNYTAARAALLDFWKTVTVYRNKFNASFNTPIYEQWLAEAVASGRIEAPGFFEDPIIRQAWCGCLWVGASMGHVDPLKEVKAAAERIRNNISTEEQEASEYNGSDWRENVRQRRKELAFSIEQEIQKKEERQNAKE